MIKTCIFITTYPCLESIIINLRNENTIKTEYVSRVKSIILVTAKYAVGAFPV